MRHTVITLISYCVLWSSFVYAADPARAQDLPAHKLAEMEPAGHDIVPGYQEQQPINDVIRSAVPAKARELNPPTSTELATSSVFNGAELTELIQSALEKDINKQKLTEEEEKALEIFIAQNQPDIRDPQNSNTNRTTFLTEGFDGTVPPTDWSGSYTGSYGWQAYAYADADSGGSNSDGGQCAYHNDDSGSQDSWLITPALDLSGATSSRLSYYNRVDFSSYADSHNVKISTDGGTTWTILESDILETGESDYTWYARTIDLTAYDGQASVKIAFHYTGNWASEWHIDDVVVDEVPATPSLDLSYSSLSFVPVEIGETSTSSAFTVGSNAGAGDLVISSITSSNSDYTVSATSDTVTGSGDVQVDLSWSPSSFGMTASDIIISHNGSTSPDTFQLKGESGHQYVNFDNQAFPGGWTIIDNDTVNAYGYDAGWNFYSSYGPGYGGYYARSHFNTDGADDWMITGKLTVAAGDSVIFRNNSSSSSVFEDTLHVYVSTTDNDMASFTTEIGEIISQGYTNIRSAFDLSSYAGSDIYIAIVHHGSAGSNYWSYRKVDDVLLPVKWVNPEAEIVLSDAELDFGGLFAGYGSETATFTISNNGSPDLSITGITSDDDEVTVSPTTATIGYDSTVTFTVTLTAVTASDTGAATLTIASNDAASDGTVSVVWETAAHDLGDFTMSTGLSDAISYGAYPDYIADDANDTISISDPSGLMEHMAIFIDLDHTWMSDLDMTITSPSGESLVFVDGLGGSGDDMLTVVMDGGSNSTAPFFPDAPSSNSLDDFVAGGGADGDWILTITDGAGGDDGTLYSWGIYYTEGESGHVTGTVTDAETGAGVDSVLVSGGTMTYTDANGDYVLEVLAGEQEIDFSKDGYNDVHFLTSVSSGDTVELNLDMAPHDLTDYANGFEATDDQGASVITVGSADFAIVSSYSAITYYEDDDTSYAVDTTTIMGADSSMILVFPDSGAGYGIDTDVHWQASDTLDISDYSGGSYLYMSVDANYYTEEDYDFFLVGVIGDDGMFYWGDDGEITGESSGWETVTMDVTWVGEMGLEGAVPFIAFVSDYAWIDGWGGAFDNLEVWGNPFYLAPPDDLSATSYGSSIPLTWSSPAAGSRSQAVYRTDLRNITGVPYEQIEDENGNMIDRRGKRDFNREVVVTNYSAPVSRDITGYNVFRQEWPFGDAEWVTTVDAAAYEDTDVSDGQYFDYWVTAVYDEGESADESNTAHARAGEPVMVEFDPDSSSIDFEEDNPFEDWEAFYSTDAAEWVVGDSADADSAFGLGANSAPDHTNFAYISDGRAGEGDFAAWLISPAVNFGEFTTAVASFDGYAQVYSNFADLNACYLLVRSDLGPWETVVNFGYDHMDGWVDYSSPVSHMASEGDVVQFALYYTHTGGWNSGYGNGIAIDNLNLTIIEGPTNLEASATVEDVTLTWGSPGGMSRPNEYPQGADVLDKDLALRLDGNAGTSSLPNFSRVQGDSIGNPFVIPDSAVVWMDDAEYHHLFYDSASTVGFTDDYDAVCPYTGSTSPDVVYEITLPASPVKFMVSLCESYYDTKVFMFDANGDEVACSDDYCSASHGQSWTSYIEVEGLPAGTYYIIIDGYGGDEGTYVMEVGAVWNYPGLTYNVYKNGSLAADELDTTSWVDNNASLLESDYTVSGTVYRSYDMGYSAVDTLIETEHSNEVSIAMVNQPPGDFSLLTPGDGDTLMIMPEDLGSSQLFAWGASVDPNGTEVEYEICITIQSPFDQFCDENGTSTANFVTFDEMVEYIDSVGVTAVDVMWTVYANDGMDETEAVNGPRSLRIDAGYALGIYDEMVPVEFALHQNYPNPFNPVTNIRFDIPEESHVRLDIYNVTGQKVATLVNGSLQPGYHSIQWNGTNGAGKQLASGMYIYRISSREFTAVKKLVLMK